MFDCVSNVVDDDGGDVNTISWTTVNRPSCCRLDIRSMRRFSKSSFLYLYGDS